MTNDELADIYQSIDLLEPTPYQASGNVVFDLPTGFGTPTVKKIDSLEVRLAQALEAQLGYPVPTLIRTASEVAALADASPFPEEAMAATDRKIQVMLLKSTPSSNVIAEVEDLLPEGEQLAFDDRVMFWLPIEGISTSTFNVRATERLLGVTTVRTQGTLQRITKKFLTV